MVQNQMVTAIVANLWTAFENKTHGLVTLIMDFDKGRVAATRSSQFVLCVYGEESVALGVLKAKAESLAQYLSGPMDQVCEAQGQIK